MIHAFGDYELDTGRFELRHRGAAVPLEPQVFEVLGYLLRHHERLVPKDELIAHVWPERYVSESALTNRVMAARRAIGDSGAEQRLIRTVHGRGFRFVGEVQRRDAVGPVDDGERPAPPEQAIRFCIAPDGVRVAYATVGAGPPLVKAAHWLSHLEFDWRSPVWRHWLTGLSSRHTLVRYDERGCGLSDWDAADVSLEAWVRDLGAVADAAGLERFPLLGVSQGGAIALTYATRHPERVSHLVLYGAYARGRGQRRYAPHELEKARALLPLIELGWGQDNPAFRQLFTSLFLPDATAEQARWFNELQRVTTSPHNAARNWAAFNAIDVSGLLPRVTVPTLVLHARDDAVVPFEEGRSLAAHIAGARFVPLEGKNHILLETEPAWPRFLAEVHRFLAA